MDTEKRRAVLAAAITEQRKAAGLTQEALAQKLNYSDKSVSKWERGDGAPDVFVLAQMAEIFGCSADKLLGLEPPAAQPEPPALRPETKTKRRLIPVLATLLVWLIAAVAFFVLELLRLPREYSSLCFVYAVPVSFIVLTVFARLWHGCVLQAAAVSGLIWGVAVSLKLSFPLRAFNVLFIVAAILQVLTVLWFFMRGRVKKQKRT